MPRAKRRGVALLLLLATIFLVVILSGVVAEIILNQSRSNQHYVERTKAYYAALGGLTIAMDRIARGEWDTSRNYHICRYTTPTGGGDSLDDCKARCDYCEHDIPYNITVDMVDLGGGVNRVNATINYTYNLTPSS